MSNNENESAQQQMVELQQPLLPSQPSDHSSSDHFQQQHEEEDDEMTICMKDMIEYCGDDALSPECCIYRVPHILRQLNKEAYTPKLVSVGPLHHYNERVEHFELRKNIMFKAFTQRAGRAGSSLDGLVRLVKHLEPKVRASYSETIDFFDKERLAKVTLVDAGFIIELFVMFHERHELRDDANLSLPSFWSYILEDLLLLENQLPFFVMEELFNKAFPHDSRDSFPSFLELTYGYFGYFNRQNLKPNNEVKINHFTDLLRLFYLQGKIRNRIPSEEAGRHILLFNANALQEKGIKLEASDNNCLLDMKLSRHILEIPQIWVESGTELLFRNMIALEQCHYPYHAYITDFALVLDCLIDTYKDVDLLVSKKIVRNYLGDSNNVASLFNGLGGNVTRWNFNSEYLDICKRLNDYCQDPWHEMKATLKRDYCHTPWQIVASIAAIVLLILTVVQTIFSILQVVK